MTLSGETKTSDQTLTYPNTDQTMPAIRVYQYGGTEQLRLEQVPRPTPQTGEVLLRVYAAGVLPADWKIRQGQFRQWYRLPFPYIPGSAVAGVVEAVGRSVRTLQVGDAVFGRSANGAYAAYTTAAAATLARKPDSIPFIEAATISGGATTAWNALFESGGLQPGQRVLIHAAAGGVGLFAVQFARIHGARPIGTTSTANVDFVRSLGAETVMQAGDLVMDATGGEGLARARRVVRRGGVLISLVEEPPQELAQQLGIRASMNSVIQPFPSTALLETIADLMATGAVKTAVARTFALSEVRQAHALSETGHGRGRIVLDLSSE